MDMKKSRVEVQPDFIEQQVKASPVQAVAELVWNGLDADAENIDVRLEANELGATTLVVRDDGTGMPYEDPPASFTRLGGSWKKTLRHTRGKGRIVHGREGRGRFKVFAIGRCAEWRVRYQSELGDLREYNITALRDRIEEVQFSSEQVVDSTYTGVEATISELHKEYHALNATNMVRDFNEIFALYLNNYRDVSITYDGHQIAPQSQIVTTHSENLEAILIGNRKHDVTLEIVEWSCKSKRALYLCTEQGFPLMKIPASVRVGNYNFSAYLKSSFIESLEQSQQLQLAKMDPILGDRIEVSQGLIKSYFRKRSAEVARSVVDGWKAEEIYPFKGEPTSDLEDVERKVFDIVAVTASDFLPEFESGSKARKAFDLRMLRTAIERNSGDLQLILNEVLDLPINKQKELASLLKETSLSSIINAVKTVTHRLKFLAGLEEILFGKETKSRLKERSQLHKILEDNIWIFGEEYMLSASDESLTTVLRKHQNLLGDTAVIDRPVEHPLKKSGIVDLMLSRTLRRHRTRDLQHLVIELKRPKIKIGRDQITQIEDYAFAIVQDERLRSGNPIWEFWLVSDDIDDRAESRILEGEQAQGTIHRRGNCVIKVKRWAQVLEDNKARLQFFQEKLEYSAKLESSLSHIQSRYTEFMTGVIPSSKSNGVSIQ